MLTPSSISRICSRQRKNAERLSRSLSRIFSPYLTLHTTKNRTRPATNQRCWRMAWRGKGDEHTASMTWLPCLRAERVRGAHQDRPGDCSSGRHRGQGESQGSAQWAAGREQGRQARCGGQSAGAGCHAHGFAWACEPEGSEYDARRFPCPRKAVGMAHGVVKAKAPRVETHGADDF